MTVRLVVRLVVGYGVLALSLACVSGAVAAGWMVQRTPNPAGARHSQLVGVSCPSMSFCIAVGYSTHGGGALVALAERWRGGSWSMQRTPKPAGAGTGVLSGVSCVSRTACIAVGYFTDRAGVAVALAEHWDGASWSVQRTPNPRGAAYSYLVGVSCASQKSCTSVGAVREPGGQEVVLAEHWNGASWSIQPVPSPRGATRILVCLDKRLHCGRELRRVRWGRRDASRALGRHRVGDPAARQLRVCDLRPARRRVVRVDPLL